MTAPSPHRSAYARLLRLRRLRLTGWQRALLVEGVLVVGALLALADAVSAWTVVVLPVAVAAAVKAQDVLTGLLDPPESAAPSPRQAGGAVSKAAGR